MEQKEQAIYIGLFAATFLIVFSPYIVYEDYYSGHTDAYFHIELVNRIRNNLPLNEEISYVPPKSWAYNGTESYNKSTEYVQDYPKTFHHIVAIIPLEANQSVGLVVALFMASFFALLLLLFRTVGLDLPTSIATLSLFILISELGICWRYIYYYVHLLYPQLMFHTILLAGMVLFIWLFNKNKVIAITIMILSLLGAVFVHNVSYELGVLIGNAPRFIPFLFTILLPSLFKILKVRIPIGWTAAFFILAYALFVNAVMSSMMLLHYVT